MKSLLQLILKPLSSLRLTVVLLALTMVLVFAGTWAQIDQDIWQVQREYFHSFFCIIDFKLFLPRHPVDFSNSPAALAGITRGLIAMFSKLSIPMLGGYSLIILLLANLLSAHAVRFKFHKLDILIPLELAFIIAVAWPFYSIGFYLVIGAILVSSIPLVFHALKLHEKRAGVVLIHLGLILLICGEVVTSLFQVEQQMSIEEGETANYASDIRHPELAVIDTSPADHDNVVAIPASFFSRPGLISYPTLPFQIHIDQYFPNSQILGPFQAQQLGKKPDPRATAGQGVGITVADLPPFGGTEADKVNAPSAYVTLRTPDGQNLGTYLLSLWMDDQPVQIGDKTYRIQLRFRREYKPYSIHLIKFSFDRFTGSDTPRNFASQILLTDNEQHQQRETRIWMNHPLRYRGETFYQAGYDERTEHGTVLQIVSNPGWVVPYISCVLVALGMGIHFGSHLRQFLSRRPARVKTQAALWPGIVTAACVVAAFAMSDFMLAGRPTKDNAAYDFASAGNVPVLYEGRVMPIDSLARNSLRVISGRSYLEKDGQSIAALQWLLDLQGREDQADDYQIFRIDFPDILNLLNLDHTRTRFSFNEIVKNHEQLEDQLNKLQGLDSAHFDTYQKKLADLRDHLKLYLLLRDVDGLYLSPPLAADAKWQTVAEASQGNTDPNKMNAGLRSVLTMLGAYHQNDPDTFNATAAGYVGYLKPKMPDVMNRVSFEYWFNRIDPFTAAIFLYVFILLLVIFSWIGARPMLLRTALWLQIATLVVHTVGLASRIYISGRPPVTNLYSSAIFIAWGAAVMCLALELIYRNGMGAIAAAIIGFLSLIIADNIAITSENGDTMHMLRAVLDTNFWLATHVVCVTLGYAATFLAGVLAVVYIVRGVFTRSLSADAGKELYRMVYGILGFAMLFSFVGTVLGGIWADQSWGRFWGWDPKENGAVLIVIWNALILHARWGGLVKARGVMNLAIFGNVVTSWSWFGTNMLGVGLHSYGFMESQAMALVAWVFLQLILIGIGSLPLGWWRSFAESPAKSAPAMSSSVGAPVFK